MCKRGELESRVVEGLYEAMFACDKEVRLLTQIAYYLLYQVARPEEQYRRNLTTQCDSRYGG